MIHHKVWWFYFFFFSNHYPSFLMWLLPIFPVFYLTLGPYLPLEMYFYTKTTLSLNILSPLAAGWRAGTSVFSLYQDFPSQFSTSGTSWAVSRVSWACSVNMERPLTLCLVNKSFQRHWYMWQSCDLLIEIRTECEDFFLTLVLYESSLTLRMATMHRKSMKFPSIWCTFLN